MIIDREWDELIWRAALSAGVCGRYQGAQSLGQGK